MAVHPGLAIINTLSKSSGPGDAAEAASWAAAHDLTNVYVWADTTDAVRPPLRRLLIRSPSGLKTPRF